MIRHALSVLVALLALTIGAAGAGAVDIQQVTSPAGIKAWLVRDPSVPIISMSFAVTGGAALDPAGKTGLARMTMGLLDEGAGDLSAGEYQSQLDDISARMSFDAGHDRIYGSLRTLRDKREKAFDLLGLALSKPRFDADAVARVRQQMFSIIKDRDSSPNSIASMALMKAVFGSHPYGEPLDGTAQTIGAIGIDDLRAAQHRLLVRDRLMVAVVGDIDVAELGPLLDRAFAGLPTGGEALNVPAWQPDTHGRTIVIERDNPQSVALFAEAGIKRDDPDWFPAYLMNYVLGGGGFNSRLTEQVREKRGLAYNVGTSLRPYREAGLIAGSVATANARVAESLSLIRQEWVKMAEHGVTDDELAGAKRYVKGSFALSFDSTASIADVLLSMQVDNLGIDYLNRRNGMIDKVTTADVARVAKRLLNVNALVTVVVGKPAGVQSTN